ncbi:hypothetical protein ACWCWD_13515 [Streptomyces sp. NPDC001493]
MNHAPGPLLPQRTALVLTLGVLIGVGAAVLGALGGMEPSMAVLTGGCAFGSGTLFFHSTIG